MTRYFDTCRIPIFWTCVLYIGISVQTPQKMELTYTSPAKRQLKTYGGNQQDEVSGNAPNPGPTVPREPSFIDVLQSKKYARKQIYIEQRKGSRAAQNLSALRNPFAMAHAYKSMPQGSWCQRNLQPTPYLPHLGKSVWFLFSFRTPTNFKPPPLPPKKPPRPPHRWAPGQLRAAANGALQRVEVLRDGRMGGAAWRDSGRGTAVRWIQVDLRKWPGKPAVWILKWGNPRFSGWFVVLASL